MAVQTVRVQLTAKAIHSSNCIVIWKPLFSIRCNTDEIEYANKS